MPKTRCERAAPIGTAIPVHHCLSADYAVTECRSIRYQTLIGDTSILFHFSFSRGFPVLPSAEVFSAEVVWPCTACSISRNLSLTVVSILSIPPLSRTARLVAQAKSSITTSVKLMLFATYKSIIYIILVSKALKSCESSQLKLIVLKPL